MPDFYIILKGLKINNPVRSTGKSSKNELNPEKG